MLICGYKESVLNTSILQKSVLEYRPFLAFPCIARSETCSLPRGAITCPRFLEMQHHRDNPTNLQTDVALHDFAVAACGNRCCKKVKQRAQRQGYTHVCKTNKCSCVIYISKHAVLNHAPIFKCIWLRKCLYKHPVSSCDVVLSLTSESLFHGHNVAEMLWFKQAWCSACRNTAVIFRTWTKQQQRTCFMRNLSGLNGSWASQSTHNWTSHWLQTQTASLSLSSFAPINLAKRTCNHAATADN